MKPKSQSGNEDTEMTDSSSSASSSSSSSLTSSSSSDSSDSDSDSDSDDSGRDIELPDDNGDPDARAERELFENPYGRKRRRRANGQEDAIYGVFGESEDDDDDKTRRKRKDLSKYVVERIAKSRAIF